jgi:hypothetical protein
MVTRRQGSLLAGADLAANGARGAWTTEPGIPGVALTLSRAPR